MQLIPISARIKAFFSRDKVAFWWNYYTNEEKKLRSMDVWELAKIINEARVRKLTGEAEKVIVAEHMLNVRLAKIQATASWGSGVLCFIGAIIGAALSVTLTMALQSSNSVPGIPELVCEKQALVTSVQKQEQRLERSLKNTPSNPFVEVIPDTQHTEKKHPNATAKP
jgi:hypothetical protein